MSSADQRILRNVPASLSVTFVDQDGAPASPAGAVTVGVVRADGTALIAPLTATTTGATAGVRTVALTAAQNTQLDRLTCTWTAASGEIVTTRVDVVGGYYFAIADLKALDGMSVLSEEALRVARQSVEEMVEARTGWVWVPRLEVETFTSPTYGAWGFPRPALGCRPVRLLRAVTVDGVAQTLTDWQFDTWGTLDLGNYWWTSATSTLQVIYEVGEDRPPRQLVEALLGAARQSKLDLNAGAGSRVLGVTNEFGNLSYARATADNLFGNPAVDAVLAFYDRRLPSIA